MKAWVTPLFRKGVRLDDAKLTVVTGQLDVADTMHPILGRLTKEAQIRDEKLNANQTPPLIDVSIDGIFGTGLRLRGIETIGGAHYAQAWWVQFQDPTSK